jgi:hypothetical protein
MSRKDMVLSREEILLFNKLSAFTMQRVVENNDLYTDEGCARATEEILSSDMTKAKKMIEALNKGYKSHIEVKERMAVIYERKMNEGELFLKLLAENKPLSVESISEHLENNG